MRGNHAGPAQAFLGLFYVRTDEEDGKGDEEEEDVGDQIEGVHEAAVVQDAQPHAVGVALVASAEGHGARAMLTNLGPDLRKEPSQERGDGPAERAESGERRRACGKSRVRRGATGLRKEPSQERGDGPAERAESGEGRRTCGTLNR